MTGWRRPMGAANRISVPTATESGAGVCILFALVSVVILLVPIRDLLSTGPNLGGYAGVDYRLYMDATTRWLNGGQFYEAYQAAPYVISAGDILYPPVALWLFVPFTMLPAVLWWAVPIGATIWALWRLRPGPISWPFLALCVAWPPTVVKIATGNPVIWSVAALAFGVIYFWPSVLVLIKPSLFPFALFGSNRRRWWLALSASLLHHSRSARCGSCGSMRSPMRRGEVSHTPSRRFP